MTHARLSQYLRRIGYTGPTSVDLDTLRRLHRLHVAAIPYENFDVQLGYRTDLDIETIFHKLVTCGGRGGWCYEMNSLFAWAVEEIGFEVDRVACGVGRKAHGDGPIGGHLALLIKLDRPYLADVGFGDGLIEPALLEEGAFSQDFLHFNLADLGQGWWRFHNHPRGGATSFDFHCQSADTTLLEEQCAWLQSSPDSPFVNWAICQRFVDRELVALRDCSLLRIGPSTVVEQVISSSEEYKRVLQSVFGIALPEIHALWTRISERHARRRAVRGAFS